MNSKNISMIPELLLPAGSLEKLKVAVLYGADAVYVAGEKFGLRTAADNFTFNELKEGVHFAHTHAVKVYVVLNSFLHQEDFVGLGDFIDYLAHLKVDAVIVSDIGVAQLVRSRSHIPLHVSTQASVLNAGSALFWKKLGATRVVVGRELSIKEAAQIKIQTGLEIEMFIHGSMCMSYSGHCVISNFTQGRDSNRGGCAHSCRFEYSLSSMGCDQSKRAFFMSSKDLNGLAVLKEFINQGVDSIKVEGRMKSPLYVATMGQVYRQALDYFKDNENAPTAWLEDLNQELSKVSHRDYTQANLIQPADASSIFNEREHSPHGEYKIAGIVREVTKNNTIIEVLNTFRPQDQLEILLPKGRWIPYQVQEMIDIQYRVVEKTKPSTLIRLPIIPQVKKDYLIRMK